MPQTTTEGAPHPRKSKVEIPHPSDEIFTQETLFYFLWVNPNFFPIEKKAEIFILINPRRELFNIFGLGKTQKKLATVRTVQRRWEDEDCQSESPKPCKPRGILRGQLEGWWLHFLVFSQQFLIFANAFWNAQNHLSLQGGRFERSGHPHLDQQVEEKW